MAWSCSSGYEINTLLDIRQDTASVATCFNSCVNMHVLSFEELSNSSACNLVMFHFVVSVCTERTGQPIVYFIIV
jgi:hypothetical protein